MTAVGVSLQDRAIHKGSRVPFIGIADHIFDISRSLGREFPFGSRRESRSTTTPQAGELHLLDHLFASHIEQGMGKSLVSTPGNVFIDLFRIDDSAIPEGDADLLAIERDFLVTGQLFVGIRHLVGESADDPSLDERFFNDRLDVPGLHLAVEDPLGIDDHDRSHGTEAPTSCLYDTDLFFQSSTGDLLGHCTDDLQGL